MQISIFFTLKIDFSFLVPLLFGGLQISDTKEMVIVKKNFKLEKSNIFKN